MANIETQDVLNTVQVSELLQWFDRTIGTDREVNPSGSGKAQEYYIVFLELEGDEPRLVAKHLDALELEYYFI